jgi:hypothetical protein
VVADGPTQLPNSGDFFVAANSQSLAATFVAATIYFVSPEKMLKTTLGSPLMT